MLKAYLAEKKELVEKNLQKILDRYQKPELYSEAMKYAVMNGGKRLRPILMYMMCDLFGRNYENIEDIACALEFIHCYSLVHDDLPAMDNDMYRRGKLTTHVKYGEAEGILVGDVLLTEAFNIVANSPAISDSNKVKIITKLSEYSGFYGMAGGQFADMKSEHVKVSFETLKYIHAHKTGKLITAAIELPLIALDIEENKKEKLVQYSKLIGIAFQIKDDILDIEGNFSETGKESNDEKNEKTTYPSLFGLEKSKEILKDYIIQAKEIIIENLKDGIFMSLNKLYVFKVTENGMEKKLNTYDIDLKKYFDYKMNIKNMVITVKDDFGYRKDTEYKLPDRIETRFFGAFDGVIQGVVKDKIIMRVINFQNYEIVFDKDLNYKLKAITPENNPLNLSVNYGLYEQAK